MAQNSTRRTFVKSTATALAAAPAFLKAADANDAPANRLQRLGRHGAASAVAD